ncbi:mannose-6-phosphate isomerase, class I [Staphylococcus cohnii]|uniref:Mannose-6-phosphate isomerase n=1 Tax=Staphylococcus cohnii subsp. cohnii TaxID=74704 RepID=A0A0M2P3M7_STACC|nr:mannose-6-phosphate isomerase, class I [Staphylococcus cohnii]TGP62445.1 mannose-6-phosphate isomerase, class I [bacterium M00.F.Ca.ET.229.01.1.1]TGS39277.1 mannose-6-phosphate isomerase, class I [bacterium M00.F.Ca.ET.180.01.1.1]AYX90816.1 mannose-6-phosphate isomerase, class I [Staphylococcus cohnii]KKI65364.1 Mannose-6-phosphate isomerase [Staphylococcus cohnii subsp. cohnii]MDE1710604.1 mannose-6-phosphate isomerase, class I [Staphylococcus cohnii]
MPLFLKPVFQERIWGGTALKRFDYQIPSEYIGECWAISAHPNGTNIIENGRYQGKTLEEVWNEDKALFGVSGNAKFPLLTKILDANDKLSVQVHPDNAYAQKYEGEYGKTECWYILDAQEDAEIIYGVNAKNQTELNDMIDQQQFDELFHKVKVKAGDFFYVPAGTVHAIGEGILILETQQSSDTTYRIYDYERTDTNGNQRELHLEQSKAVINLAATSPNTTPKQEVVQGQTYTQFVSNDFFTVERWMIDGMLNYEKPSAYCLVSIVEGTGNVETNDEVYKLEKGTHFILTTEDHDIAFNGDMTMIISYV